MTVTESPRPREKDWPKGRKKNENFYHIKILITKSIRNQHKLNKLQNIDLLIYFLIVMEGKNNEEQLRSSNLPGNASLRWGLGYLKEKGKIKKCDDSYISRGEQLLGGK